MQQHSPLIPVIVALIIAVVGQGIILFGDSARAANRRATG